MLKLNKEQIKSLIPHYTCHIAQELEYAYREEAPFGQIKIEVYADDTSAPRTMFLIDGFAGTALYGDASIDENNQAIKKLILDCFAEEGKEVWLSLYSPGWEAVIDSLFEGFPSWRANRLIHRINMDAFQKHRDWQAKIPAGYDMVKVDTPSYESIKSRYPNFTWKPEADKFGWFLLKDGEVVSGCTSVWVEKVGVEVNCVEIGIETNETYRRKGYAVLTAAAFVDDCLLRKLIPVWCCWDFTEGSKELAEKLGFEIVEDRRAVFLKEK